MPIMYSGGAGNISSAQITDGAIIDDDINAAAAIAFSKLAGVAAKGANSDITSLSGLTTPLSLAQGGTGLTATKYFTTIITRDGNAADGAVNTAHGLAVTPKRIKVTVIYSKFANADVGDHSRSDGTYDGTTINCIYEYFEAGNSIAAASSTAYIARIQTATNAYATAVPSFDGTNVTLTWTKSGVPEATVAQIIIEAWGY